MTIADMSAPGVEARLAELAPWHFKIELLPGVWTQNFNRSDYSDPDQRSVGLIDPAEMSGLMDVVLPGGMKDRTFLDVGCNGGGYCFLAYEKGAKECRGFDIRQHWIDQCGFIMSVKYPECRSVHFHVADAKTFAHKSTYDVTLFKGVLYHLPDPISTLNRLCALTARAIIVDTVCRSDIPEDTLVPWWESKTHLMSGIDGLAWFPGGPKAVHAILSWSGFPHMRTVNWRKGTPDQRHRGRMRVVAFRQESDLEAYDASGKPR
jgi:SAM-dependent methyltransferase